MKPHLNAYDNPNRKEARKMEISGDILTRTKNAGTAKHFTNYATTTKVCLSSRL
jgi:hypothetical protein